MNTKTILAGLLAMTGAAGPLSAASVAVDWLQFVPGGTAAGFTLRGDDGTNAATGSVVVSSGIVFSSTPVARNLGSGFWGAGVPLVDDSVAGDGSVSGFDVRVVPIGGQAAWQVELSVPENRTLYLVVGDLYRTAASATTGVEIRAFSGSAGSVGLIGTLAGSDDRAEYNGPLGWDGVTLSTAPGADGESVFAFFEIGPLTGGNARVVLTIPQGYASGSGDSVFFALGVSAVPEPSSVLLGTFGALVLLGRRHRRKG